MTRDQAPVFSRAAILWMTGLTVGSLVFAFLWSGLAGDLNEPHSAGNDSYSVSAVGHRAFAELLSRLGVSVKRKRVYRTGTLDERSALIVAEPNRETEHMPGFDEFNALVAASADRRFPIVLVLPKRIGTEDVNHPGWLGVAGLMPLDSVRARVRDLTGVELSITRRKHLVAGCTAPWGKRISVELSDAQLITAGANPVLTCDSGMLVGEMRLAPRQDSCDCDTILGRATLVSREAERARKSKLYVVSDPDLIATIGLGSAENADVVYGLLTRVLHARTVWFDETWHHPALRMTLITELLRYPLVLTLVQATLLMTILFWSSVSRFGKAREVRPPEESKRALVNSIAGLMRATRRPADTLETYLGQSLRYTAERYGVPAELGLAEVGARLGKIARLRGVRLDISRVMYLVEGLKQSSEGESQAVVHTAQDIHRWYEDMNHDR